MAPKWSQMILEPSSHSAVLRTTANIPNSFKCNCNIIVNYPDSVCPWWSSRCCSVEEVAATAPSHRGTPDAQFYKKQKKGGVSSENVILYIRL